MKDSELPLRGLREGFARKAAMLIVVLCAVGGVWVGVRAQALTKAAVSGSAAASSSAKNIPPRPAEACCGYPFPRSWDAEIADSDVHRVFYEDPHIMLIEVDNPPLLHVKMHGHPFTSVFAHDSTTGPHNPDAPAVAKDQVDPHLDPSSSYNNMGGDTAPAPAGMKWPTCTPAAAQAPHQGPFNTGLAPNHFYRLEFLRVEGNDFQTNWKEWYPEMTKPTRPVADLVPGPALGPKFSEKWPYPIAYDSIQAAPNNYRLLYEDGKIRLVEVTIRPGETTPMHGDPYPAVLAYNGNLDSSQVTETWLDPNSPLDGKGGGHAGPPHLHNLTSPTCGTMAPEAPPQDPQRGQRAIALLPHRIQAY